MIVAADPAHDPKEWLWRNEDTETVAENDERCRNVERPRQQEHGKGHGNASNNSGEKTAKHCFGSCHHYWQLSKSMGAAQATEDRHLACLGRWASLPVESPTSWKHVGRVRLEG